VGLLRDRWKPSRVETDLPAPFDIDYLRWSTVAAADAADHPWTIEDVLKQEHEGFLVTGVLDPDELERANRTFRGHADWHEVGYGGLWGQPVGIAWDGDRKEYFDKADAAREAYHDVFGFDIVERLETTFASMAGPYGVDVVEEDGRQYLPGGFREMRPGAGGLPAHTGNEFFDLGLDGPLNHIAAITDYVDSLSWFIMMDPPEKGGELRLYDLKYDERPDLRGFNNFERDDTPFDDMTTSALVPAAGDLVWFRGGNQWHKVAQIEGQRARVTFGGFMAPTLDHRTLLYWA